MSATDDLCRSYLDLKWHFDPAAASAAGLAEHDKRLGSFDAESVRRHLAAVRALAAAAEEADVEAIDEEIDRTALLNELRATVRRFDVDRPQVRDPGFWLGHLFGALYALVARRPDPSGDVTTELATRAGAAVDRLAATPAFLDAAVAELKQPPQVFVDSALQTLGGGGELIARMSARLAADAPELAPQLQAAAGEALQALTRFGRKLATEIQPSDDPQSFAIGEEAFERRLHEELALSSGLAQVWRYGERLQAEVEAQIVEVARRIDPARPWREVVERVREQTPPPDGVLDAYRAEVDRALGLVETHDLVAVPPGPLEVTATPSFLRPLTPFAAYMPPPIYRGDRTGDFFVTVPDPAAGPAAAALLRAHASAGIPSTVAHETYPGHHLHLLTLRDLGSEVRRHLWTPIMVEGWALYSEELLGEVGYYRRDEERLLQLVNLLWRAVRIELDIALHTRGLAPSAAVDRLVERIPMERSAAEGEVRRYCAWPTYQLSYALGRRELLELRDAWRRTAGATAPLRAFHDALLAYGGLAPSLARWGMGLG